MLKNFILLLSSISALSSLTSCNEDGPLLTVLGLDKDGKELEMKISETKFRERFTEILNSASVSSLDTLSVQDGTQTKWALSEVELGIDLQLKGEITSIVTVGVGSGAALTLSRESSAQRGNNE